MLASYVPRTAFSAWHDPSYDVIGQLLGGSGSWNFQGDVEKMVGKLYKNGDIRPVNKKDTYSRKKNSGGIAWIPFAGET